MARDKKLVAVTDNSDLVKYPNGRVKNNTGAGDGTAVNEAVYGDIQEFFAKIMRLAAISYSGVPDNETTGYQYIDAMRALATKNDMLYSISLSSSTTLSIPLKLSKVLVGESFICIAAASKTTQTKIVGALDSTLVEYTVTFKGGNFLANEYIRLIKTSGGFDVIRLSDGAAFDAIAASNNYLKAATQAEEDAGAISNKSTTPLTNFTAFALRVIGAQSVNFLATAARNGLMSLADKAKLDGLGGVSNKYGTISIGDVNTVTRPVGFNYPVTDNISSATVSSKGGGGEEITVTLDSAMTSSNYSVRFDVESLGNIRDDNDIQPMLFKKINTTQFIVFVQEDRGTTQNIKLHIDVIQR